MCVSLAIRVWRRVAPPQKFGRRMRKLIQLEIAVNTGKRVLYTSSRRDPHHLVSMRLIGYSGTYAGITIPPRNPHGWPKPHHSFWRTETSPTHPQPKMGIFAGAPKTPSEMNIFPYFAYFSEEMHTGARHLNERGNRKGSDYIPME